MFLSLYLAYSYDLAKGFTGSEVEEKQLLEAIQKAFLLLKRKSKFAIPKNEILLGFGEKVIADLLPLMDQEGAAADLKTKLEQIFVQEIVGKNFEETQNLVKELLLMIFPDKKTVIMQSPRICPPEVKTEVRAHYGHDFFVSFFVKKELLGGLVSFVDSKLNDLSWLGKIITLKKMQKSINKTSIN